MKKFRIEFKHTLEQFYVAIIEAKSEKEAKEIFDEEPFEHLQTEEPFDEQGLHIDVLAIEELEWKQYFDKKLNK